MKVTKVTVLLLGVLAASQIPAACSVYDESLLAGGAGAGGDASTGPCLSATWPQRPTAADLGAGNDFVAALTMFDFGEPYEGSDGGIHSLSRDIGYDIDFTCTAQSANETNLNPDPTMTGSSSCEPLGVPGFRPRVGDLPQGRDNGLRALIDLVQGVLEEFGTPAYNANILSGRTSLLIGVNGYNGAADDDEVTVTLYSPAEFASISENTGKTPKFDGQDLWPVSADSFQEDRSTPKFITRRGYVRDNVLVAAIKELDLPLRIGISSQDVTLLQVKFIDAFLTANIGRDPQTNLWTLKKGVIAARWKTDDLFDMLSRFPNPAVYPDPPGPGENPFFCASAAHYKLIREFICVASDIYSGGTAAGTQCDSLSVGIGFESVEALLGPVVDAPPAPENPCGDADPAGDSCQRVADGLPAPGQTADAGSGDGGL